MTRYDFTEAAEFLDNSVPLSDLYEDVVQAMHDIGERRYLTREGIVRVWGTLLACADFLDTINVVGEGGDE